MQCGENGGVGDDDGGGGGVWDYSPQLESRLPEESGSGLPAKFKWVAFRINPGFY